MSFKTLSLLFTFFISQASATEISIVNSFKLRERLGTERLLIRGDVRSEMAKLKIAIIDNGFGSQLEREQSKLPKNLKVVEFYSQAMIDQYDLNPDFKGNAFIPTRHGLVMAQIVYEASTKQEENAPDIYLLNGNGFTNFRRAVRFAIEQNIDVILYSQNWEYGGNFDGKGFINTEVSKATQAGILWINAAGNYGDKVYHGPVLGKKKLYFKNEWDQSELTFTLSWSDFTNDFNDVATKDLDFKVFTAQGELVGESSQIQGKIPTDDHPEFTQYAREKLSLTLASGSYYVEIIDRSGNFSTDDNFRLVIDSSKQGLDFIDRTPGKEIMTPADHPNVISVGDQTPFSATGPTVDGRIKPEVVLSDSKVLLSDGFQTSGTSNAAAMMAAVALVYKAAGLNFNSTINEKIESTERRYFRGFPQVVLNKIKQNLGSAGQISFNFAKKQMLLPIVPGTLTGLFPNLENDRQRSNRSYEDYRYFVRQRPGIPGAFDSYFEPLGFNARLGQEWFELSFDPLVSYFQMPLPVWSSSSL